MRSDEAQSIASRDEEETKSLQGNFLDAVDVNGDVKNAGRYYRLFLVMQGLMLFGFLFLRDLAARDPHSARMRRAYLDITGCLPTALEMFKSDCGRYPTTEEGLNVLITAPTNGSLTNWQGPYLDPASSSLEDPWGHEYVYRFPAVHGTSAYDISSPGHSIPATMSLAKLIERNRDWLLFIPFLFLVGMIAQLTSANIRAVARENQWVDWLWFAMALIAFSEVLLFSRFSG